MSIQKLQIENASLKTGNSTVKPVYKAWYCEKTQEKITKLLKQIRQQQETFHKMITKPKKFANLNKEDLAFVESID